MGDIKISFIGDIMCEKPFLYAAKTDENTYDFEKAFFGLKDLFQKSDYVIGNLETVCAGEDKRYTRDLYSFNTPDSFINALKKCGINFVSTANNHCLDRGVEGLKRTLDILDSQGIGHTGTYRSKEEYEQPCIIEIKGLKLGFAACTYGTNININRVLLSDKDFFHVDLFQPQYYKRDSSLLGRIKSLISVETKTRIKRILGRSYKNITIDCMPQFFDIAYLERVAELLKQMEQEADYSVCLLHCGGQFNLKPGEYSEYMMDFLQRHGAESIIGNHSHNVQKSKILDNGIAAYCLGNVSISPSSIYVPMENRPDYSIVVHMYFGQREKKVLKITASVLRIVEDEKHYIYIMPVNKLYETAVVEEKERIATDTKKVLEVFTGRKIADFEMKEEWLIEGKDDKCNHTCI